MKTIAFVESPFREKFGTPSGPSRVPSAKGIIRMQPEFADPYAFDGIEKLTHIWLIYLFHLHAETPWRAKVRPPRLGGDKKMGVFATRSPVRPNPIGLSCVKLDKIVKADNTILLHVSGLDLVDGTPILDIKPYRKDVDVTPEASDELSNLHPWKEKMPVYFENDLKDQLATEEVLLIEEVLSLDPRPSRERQIVSSIQKEYNMWLGNWDLTWICNYDSIMVTRLVHRP